MIITLPLPPTDNRRLIFARYQGRMVSSTEYRRWFENCEIKWIVEYRDLKPLKPSFENQITIPYKLYQKDKRSDIQNYEKSLKDFLSKRLYSDDKYIKLDLILPVTIDKANPRVEIDFGCKLEIN